jgi:hypothetical protein
MLAWLPMRAKKIGSRDGGRLERRRGKRRSSQTELQLCRASA